MLPIRSDTMSPKGQLRADMDKIKRVTIRKKQVNAVGSARQNVCMGDEPYISL